MLISLIVAMASNRVIGHQGDIPWKIPGEQKMFKEITLGHVVIMGRKTYESLACPLPGRTNIVVTRQTDYQAPDCIIAQNLDEAISMADRIYLTVIPREIPGDTLFPEISETDFEIVKSEFIDGVVPYHFYIYRRV